MLLNKLGLISFTALKPIECKCFGFNILKQLRKAVEIIKGVNYKNLMIFYFGKCLISIRRVSCST